MYSRPMCGQGVVRKQRQATWTKNALCTEVVVLDASMQVGTRDSYRILGNAGNYPERASVRLLAQNPVSVLVSVRLTKPGMPGRTWASCRARM